MVWKLDGFFNVHPRAHARLLSPPQRQLRLALAVENQKYAFMPAFWSESFTFFNRS
jgi:hypothetical protein